MYICFQSFIICAHTHTLSCVRLHGLGRNRHKAGTHSAELLGEARFAF